MWAVQRCHIYVVHLLLQSGADPLIVDNQGYNMLHLATHDGNVFMMLVLLHQNIPVDSPDPSGHTCLMWSGYKGYPACVELLLQWGASVNVRDEKGFTALHWALVKGNAFCIRKLIESGSDRFAETNDGKTPALVAHEMKSKGPWHRCLKALGFNSDGTQKQLPLPYTTFVKTRVFHTRFFFLLPFFEIIVILGIMGRMVIFLALPLAMFLLYTMQFAAQQVFPWSPTDMKQWDHTSLPSPPQKGCNILSDGICEYVLRDSFTVALAIWVTLHLSWVSMLIFTHLFLVSKAQTTWESMRGHGSHITRTSEVVTAAVTSGSTSMDAAQISDTGPSSAASGVTHQRRPSKSWFGWWKTLLGLDSFVATASGKATKRRNPFSRGLITNCKDFWCDSAPYLTMRENGSGTLDGESVNYVMMYEPPLRQRTREGGSGGVYHNIDVEDGV
ncbi:uncharacterized protein KY384_003141 [Bacidia gigantensis]|uniref:uncharacterized protein n=1 Tax=Bacidia gigantensis TaxID=2732470 RepID=UPI001D0424A5|nr:uncharacterized protein KY384_003141 [Bacidia gigantensis]KAG8531512.1 hypothetical protein KY384_003141 [Bacidia gigantensis]